MAVNKPSPRAQPEDKVCLRSHNSLATSQSLIIYLLLEVIGAMQPVNLSLMNRHGYVLFLATRS